MRLVFVLAMSLAAAMVFEPSSALGCKVGPPPAFDVGGASADPPPAVQISSITVSLGPNYGSPGPGDCSDLGRVEIALATPDGSLLDRRFGAKVIVTAGDLPAVAIDLGSWVGAIENNRIGFSIADRNKSSVDFTVAVQAVNAAGQAGEVSAPVRRTAGGGCGCRVGGAGGDAGVLALSLAALAARLLARNAGARVSSA